MQKFEFAQEAKEFLVDRIVEEAQHEGIPLSEIERKMLYFDQSTEALPEMREVRDAFDRDYDPDQYEEKIRSLSRRFCQRARQNRSPDFAAWKAATRRLRGEDDYLSDLLEIVNHFDAPLNLRLMVLAVSGALVLGIVFVILYAVRR